MSGRGQPGDAMAGVTVSVRDARATPADRLWIQSVYRDYLDDLESRHRDFPALGEVGHREPDQIAHWFGDPNAYPLVIVRAAKPVGFARVAARAKSPPRSRASTTAWRSSSWRAHGGAWASGATAVQLILSRFAGRWEITEYLRNTGAVNFWRRVVASYTLGQLPGTHRQRRSAPGV